MFETYRNAHIRNRVLIRSMLAVSISMHAHAQNCASQRVDGVRKRGDAISERRTGEDKFIGQNARITLNNGVACVAQYLTAIALVQLVSVAFSLPSACSS